MLGVPFDACDEQGFGRTEEKCLFADADVLHCAVSFSVLDIQHGDVVVAKRGVPSNTATLCLILRLFLPIIPPMIIQDKINQIVGDNRVLFTALQKEHIEKKPTPAPNLSIPDELKKYKELLDCQAITQEEYDKKKSELLNL